MATKHILTVNNTKKKLYNQHTYTNAVEREAEHKMRRETNNQKQHQKYNVRGGGKMNEANVYNTQHTKNSDIRKE